MQAAKAALTTPRGGLPQTSKEHGHLVERLRIWRWPSFDPSFTWVLLDSQSIDQTVERSFVRQLRWRTDFDEARIRDPMAGLRFGFHTSPTIEATEADIPALEITNKIRQLERMNLAALPVDNSIVLDGTCSGVSIPGHADVEWRSSSSAWAQLDDWIEAQRSWFDSLLDEAS